VEEDKIIAITLGDPAGVGPEISAKIISKDSLRRNTKIVLVGCQWSLEMGANAAGLRLPELHFVNQFSDCRPGINVLDIGVDKPSSFSYGQVQADCGQIAVASVEMAAKACLSKEVSGMVTCPLNKEAIHEAGFVDDLGHQEILVRLSKVDWTATMLMTPGLKVAHLSTHKSLVEAASYVTKDNILTKLELIRETLVGWGLNNPKIAVAALNPHGGEGGLLGREEIEEIGPAVELSCQKGYRVVGPIPSDSVFYRAIEGEFDVVLALYHDQGHIAIKVHNFHESTTATLGIPFVRTSVDHGTAFDIAGTGKAKEQGLESAIRAAHFIVDQNLDQF